MYGLPGSYVRPAYTRHIKQAAGSDYRTKTLLPTVTYSVDQSPSWEANRFSVKKSPTFCGTRRFITALTSAHHLSLSWARSIHSMLSYPTSCRSILISPSHLRLGLPSGLFPSGFPTKTVYTPLLSPYALHALPLLILLDLITRTILVEEYRSWNSPICSFLHSPVTSALLGPNNLLCTLFLCRQVRNVFYFKSNLFCSSNK